MNNLTLLKNPFLLIILKFCLNLGNNRIPISLCPPKLRALFYYIINLYNKYVYFLRLHLPFPDCQPPLDISGLYFYLSGPTNKKTLILTSITSSGLPPDWKYFLSWEKISGSMMKSGDPNFSRQFFNVS